MKNRFKAKAALAAAALALLSACSSGTLPDYNILGNLRILALKADTPEVDPAGAPTVNVTPVVSDVLLGRTLTYSAMGCIDPGVGYGATPSCTGVPGAATLGTGTITSTTLDASYHTNTGAAPSVAVPIPATLLTVPPASAMNAFNGVAYLFIYTLSAANTDGSVSKVVSFKRIVGSTKATKNTNPSITAVNAGSATLVSYLGGLVFPLASGTTTILSPVFSTSSTETYPQQNSDGSQSSLTESLTTTWFVSDGSTTFYRTTATDTDTWTPPVAPPVGSGSATRGIAVIAVTRDGRGGEDYNISIH